MSSSLFKDLEKIIYCNGVNFFNDIKEKFAESLDENGDAFISLNDIIHLWDEWNCQSRKEVVPGSENGSDDDEKNVKNVLSEKQNVNDVLGKVKKTKPESNLSSGGCTYINSRGDNKGKPCGGKISPKSTSGKYCTKHLKSDESGNSDNGTIKSSAIKKDEKPKKLKDDFTASTKEELKQKIEERKTTIPITRNKWGNYEHADSHIVLDRETHMAVGKQLSDGKISPLSAEDIEMCKMLNFKYKIPESISSSSKKVIVCDESDDEDIYDDEDDIDEEEDD